MSADCRSAEGLEKYFITLEFDATKVYPVGTLVGEGSTGFTPQLFIFPIFAWIEIHLIFGHVRVI